jgi:hypothetical protein
VHGVFTVPSAILFDVELALFLEVSVCHIIPPTAFFAD